MSLLLFPSGTVAKGFLLNKFLNVFSDILVKKHE